MQQYRSLERSSNDIDPVLFLDRALRFLERNRDCAEDHVQHTGRLAYGIIIAAALYRETDDQRYARSASTTAQLVLEQFRHNGYAYVFYPGLHDGRNASTNAIDCGCAVDALSIFMETFGRSERVEETIRLCLGSYLLGTCEKEITNQRLWAATGVASALNVLGPRLGDTLRDHAIGMLSSVVTTTLGEQVPGGAFPYWPNASQHKRSAGLDGTTTYYHSRCLTFLHRVGQVLRACSPEFAQSALCREMEQSLAQGVRYLSLMYQPNGTKSLNLECKRWYWAGSYEVASHPYDVYSLLHVQGRGLEPRWQEALAALSLRQLVSHQDDEGAICPTLPQRPNWQCRVMFTSHLAWAARLGLKRLRSLLERDVRDFVMPNAECGDLVRIADHKTFLLVHTAKRPANSAHGELASGVVAQNFQFSPTDANVLWQPLPFHIDTLRPIQSWAYSIRDFWVGNRAVLRTRIHKARIEFRDRRRYLFAITYLYRYWLRAAWAYRFASTRWDLSLRVHSRERNDISFTSSLCTPQGKPVGRMAVRQSFGLGNEGLVAKFEDASAVLRRPLLLTLPDQTHHRLLFENAVQVQKGVKLYPRFKVHLGFSE